MKLLSTIALMSASSIETSMLYERNLEEVKQREMQLTRMNNVMSKFVPHQFIQALGHTQIFDVRLGDKAEREVTIFFADIRDYTTLSERMTLTENFDFISDYHQAVGPVIRNFDGFITQYLGDGIMAVFPRHTDDSVQAAIEMQEIITRHNEKTSRRNQVNVGMGMHTGPLIMGVVGDPDRMNPAMIADTVNSASRMEGLCKFYGSKIIVSKDTFLKLTIKDSIAWRCLGKIRAKGKLHAMEVYDIFEADDPDTKRLKSLTTDDFASALRYYQSRQFDEATSYFAQVLSRHPEDKAAQLYLNKSIQYQSMDALPDSWSGVEEMIFK